MQTFAGKSSIFSFNLILLDNKEYVIYTKNEKDDNGNVTIYVSNITRVGNEATLNTVSDDNEWSRIKDLLRELSKNE